MANPFHGKRRGVLLVDDHPVVLAGMAHIINAQPDLMCCGEADTLAAARKAVRECRPDLITVDLRLPDGDGVELIEEFTASHPDVPILVVSQFDETVYAERVLKAGARGYVMKERLVEDIIVAIRSVLLGELSVSAKVAALALHQMAGRKAKGEHPLDALTNRELQVFQMLGAGLGSRGISQKLNLSIKTVETHRENIKRKLGIRDAVGLVHRATHWVQGEGASLAKLRSSPHG